MFSLHSLVSDCACANLQMPHTMVADAVSSRWQWRMAAWQRFGSGARQIPGRQEMFNRKER
jgi:hypothetical protein